MSWLNEKWRLAALFLLPFFLYGCGFQPLYGTVTDNDSLEVGTYLASVKIETHSGLLGNQLKTALEDRLNPASANSLYGKAFTLALEVKSKADPLLIESDGSILRYNINLTSTYKLMDAETGELLTKGTIRRVASYNNADEKFASYIAERDAVQTALEEMSEDYKMRLAAYFAQNYKLGAKTVP